MNADLIELRRLIDEQRAEFLLELPNRLLIIESLCHRLAAGRANAFDRRQLQRVVHGLAGAGGMYGYPELGAAARRLELAVDSEDRQNLGHALQSLKGQLP